VGPAPGPTHTATPQTGERATGPSAHPFTPQGVPGRGLSHDPPDHDPRSTLPAAEPPGDRRGHRQNILDTRFDSIGVGVTRGGNGQYWMVQELMDQPGV